MTLPAKITDDEAIEAALIEGDLSKLSIKQRITYYNRTCESVGLNPLTKPFGYIVLNGKLTLYALRTCTDQLRKIHNISLEIVSSEITDEVLTVHARATMPNGRKDEDIGVVPFPNTLRGEAKSNTFMKAVTKAKRRVTLSLCGLGYLDETEVETIPGARKPPEPAPNVLIPKDDIPQNNLPPHDPETGELTEQPKQGVMDMALEQSLLYQARFIADKGTEKFSTFYAALSQEQRDLIKPIGQELRDRINAADDKVQNVS